MATAGLALDQAIVRLPRTAPLLALGVAVSWIDWPACSDAVPGVIVIVAIGSGATVIVEVAVFPALEAVTVAVPDATAVTSPDEETVAMSMSELCHATGCPVMVLPDASVRRVVSWLV